MEETFLGSEGRKHGEIQNIYLYLYIYTLIHTIVLAEKREAYS